MRRQKKRGKTKAAGTPDVLNAEEVRAAARHLSQFTVPLDETWRYTVGGPTADDTYKLIAAAVSDMSHNIAMWNYYRAAGDVEAANYCLNAYDHKASIAAELARTLRLKLLNERDDNAKQSE